MANQLPIISIPNQGKVAVTNISDLFGNIEYTKNISFLERGYVKLTSRTVALLQSQVDANLGLPLSFGRALNDQFYIASSIKSYIFNTEPTNWIISQDLGTAAPTSVLQGYGAFWQNNWHVTDGVHINIKDRTTGNWSFAGAPFVFGTVGVAHQLEPFINRASLCASDGNVVRQFSTAYVAGGTGYPNLTLPVDYEVTSIKYNNFKMGIATKLSNTAFWQNQDAFFGVWDGSTAVINSTFAIGSDTIVCLVPYKTTWAMLTRRGRVLAFNGGGFDELGRLNFNYKNRIWSDPVALKALGSCMSVEDDLIYINIPTQYNPFGKRGQQYQENSPGGVWCYDPSVGLHQKWSASNSLLYYFGTTAGNIVLSTGKFFTNQNLPPNGSPVKIVDNPLSLPGGLMYNTVYYITVFDSTHYGLALTKQDALDMQVIKPTSQADVKIIGIDVQDYGVNFTTGTSGGIGITGAHTVIHDSIFFGSDVLDGTTNALSYVVNMAVPGFKNIGYFVTDRMTSSAITDMLIKAVLKYKPLKSGDGIILKVKEKDVLGLPITTPQYSGSTQWTSATVITTTADVSEAYNFFANGDPDYDHLECEIISGAGAGQMPKVSNFTFLAGTYTITLAESVDGAAAGKFCNIKLENWKVFAAPEGATVKGYEDIGVGRTSKSQKLKVILYGDGTTLETVQALKKQADGIQ